MGEVHLIDGTPPLFVIKASGKLGLEECQKQCGFYDEVFKGGDRFVSFIDYRQAKLKVTIPVSRFLDKWSKDNRENMRRLSPMSAIVINSAFVKTIINPLLKLMRLPNEVQMFNDIKKAKGWLERGAKKHGIIDPLNWPAY